MTTSAPPIPTLPADALRPYVVTYRADDLSRFDGMVARYGIEQWTAEALSRELFGMPLAMVLDGTPATLGPDWRAVGVRG